MNMSISIILAIALDAWLGEPKKYHPLVFFGHQANKIEKRLNQQSHSTIKQKILGLIAIFIMIVPLTIFVFNIVQLNWVYNIFAPIILYFCIAGKSLNEHAENVLSALNMNDVDLAKNRAGMIVSREIGKMNFDEIRKATIESVLENGADAVFAPIFWFILAGPAGAVMYRLVNTLDAMWGYKNKKYLYYGWAAARFDDILNWIPARLTALSYAFAGQTTSAIRCWQGQAHLLDSPNAGPVMTAGAGALDIQLGGPAWYHGKLKHKIFFGTDKNTVNEDINKGLNLVTRCIYLWITFIIVLQFIVYKQ